MKERRFDSKTKPGSNQPVHIDPVRVTENHVPKINKTPGKSQQQQPGLQKSVSDYRDSNRLH